MHKWRAKHLEVVLGCTRALRLADGFMPHCAIQKRARAVNHTSFISSMRDEFTRGRIHLAWPRALATYSGILHTSRFIARDMDSLPVPEARPSSGPPCGNTKVRPASRPVLRYWSYHSKLRPLESFLNPFHSDYGWTEKEILYNKKWFGYHPENSVFIVNEKLLRSEDFCRLWNVYTSHKSLSGIIYALFAQIYAWFS